MAKHTTTPVWPVLTIAECASAEPYSTQIGPFGKALTPEAYKPSGVPLLRGVNVNRGRFHDDDYVFISEADADRLLKFESFPGDVLLVHKGSLGQIGLMPERRRFDRYIMGNSMMRVRCERSKLLPEYLRYWLQSSDGQSYLLGRVSQVGVPQLQRPLTTLREAALPVPPVAMQQHVVDVLGCLEDKIEQNRRTARMLEALARAVFKAWFVDFEPVKAKAAGATAFPGMPAAAFAALPTGLVNSSIGPVPEGWQVVGLNDATTTIETGKRPKGGVSGYSSGVPSVGAESITRIGEYDFGKTKYVPETFFDAMRKGVLVDGDVLLYKDGGRPSDFQPHVSMVGRRFPFERMCINEHVFRTRAREPLTQNYLYLWLSSDGAMEEMRRRGTGVAIPGLSAQAAKEIATLIPSEDVARAFDDIADPLLSCCLTLAAESAKLAALRDYLLPRLLSGRVRVRGAELAGRAAV